MNTTPTYTPQWLTLFRRFTNAHFASCADEHKEGASDAAVSRRYDASNEAEKAFLQSVRDLDMCAGYWGAVWANLERLRPFFFNRNVVLKPDGSFDGGAMAVVELKAMASEIATLTAERDALLLDKARLDWLESHPVCNVQPTNLTRAVIDHARENEVADSMRQAPVD